MNRDVFVRMGASVIVGLGAVQAWGASGDSGSAASRIEVDPNSGRSLEGLPLWSPDSIIVKFAPGVTEDFQVSILEQNLCTIEKSCNPTGIHLVRIPPGEPPEQIVAQLGAFEGIEYAELNYYVYSTFHPNDELYPLQWHLDNRGSGGIRMEKAWNVQQCGADVVVAIVDTGVAFEDFEGFKRAPDLAGVPFVRGYDFANEDDHPNDDHGHGTHVAGTIAQSTNNDIGVAGIAFGCSIMPVKVLDGQGVGSTFNVARGIYFAIEEGARVVNMSLGSRAESKTLKDAVVAAYEQGVTCVCAAGNDGLFGNPISYPAGYQEYVIGVAATRCDETRSWFSTAQTYVDVAAPGGDLSVDQNKDGYPDGVLQQTISGTPANFAYRYLQGTSMATPHVTGLAALLASRGVTRPDKIAEALAVTARDRGPVGWDREYGWGLIDASAALAWRVQGDFGSDNVVDVGDLMAFFTQWLEKPVSSLRRLDSDLNCDRRVDLKDFAIFAVNWDR